MKLGTGENKTQAHQRNKPLQWAEGRVGGGGLVSCVDHLSGLTLPFSVFQLFYNILSCRKMIIVQMTLVHRNLDYLGLAGMQLNYCLVHRPLFASMGQITPAFLHRV